MLRSTKPLVALVLSGLILTLLLWAGSAWSQASYDYFAYLPLVARQAKPSLTPTSWINCHLSGRVQAVMTPQTLVPLNGATISYTHTSYISGPGHTGITFTNASGQYVFEPVGVHDTDSIRIQAQAEGYTSELHAGHAIDTCLYGRNRDFVLLPWTPTPTSTPTPSVSARKIDNS